MNINTTALVLAADDPEPKRPMSPFENPIFLMVMIFVLIYFFLIRPEKRKQDEKMQLLENLKKNDRVITTGGMYGTIVNIKGDEVTLRVDDQAKVKIRFLKNAVASVVSPSGGDAESSEEAKKS